jgi:hypothetical protein
MTFLKLRLVEFAAATLVSIVILLGAIAPALLLAPGAPAASPRLHAAGSPGIECQLSPEWRLA